MDMIRFEWDENKNRINRSKHGIDFQEAATVFYDSNAVLIPDPDHSEEEDRFILLGLSSELHMLVVCHCYRESETVIRIISARKVTTKETRQYNDFMGV